MASLSINARTTSHRRKIALGRLLAAASWMCWVLAAPTASGTALEPTNGSVTALGIPRHLDEVVAEEIGSATASPEVDEIQTEGDAATNPCDLCQGLTILNDVEPGHHLYELDYRWTCADANLYFQTPGYPFVSDMDVAAVTNATEETVINLVGSCRSDPAFNNAFEQCCQPIIPFYECEANVAESFFGEGGSYGEIQRAIPPIVSGDQTVNVTVWLTYQALGEIDEEAGTATIFVSLTLVWNDPRLKWDISDEKCTNVIDVWTSHTSVGDTQIWTPDFDLTNTIEGMRDLPEVKANVFSDGTVQLVQTGGITAFCAFRGLGRIPFDTLGCQFSFGSQDRLHSNLLRYLPITPDYTWTSNFRPTYNEWRVTPELTEQGTDNNGFMYFNFYFSRARQHYIGNIVVPTIILTYLSFVAFLLDMRVGERLGFGMALALVIVAQQIITSDLLPVSYNYLWLDKIVQWSFYWVVIVMIESVFIGFLYFYRQDEPDGDPDDDETPDEEASSEEERRPLAKGAGTDDEAGAATDEGLRRGFRKLWSTILHKCPIRLIDYTFLFLCLSSYTVFLVVMFVTAHHGTLWLRNEPDWDSEVSTHYPVGQPYPNQNPFHN